MAGRVFAAAGCDGAIWRSGAAGPANGARVAAGPSRSQRGTVRPGYTPHCYRWHAFSVELTFLSYKKRRSKCDLHFVLFEQNCDLVY